MNRVWLLTVLIIAVGGLCIVVAVAGRDSGPPEQVRTAAEAYAQLLNSHVDQYVTVRSFVRAARPQAMRAEMSDLTYSGSLFFRSSYPLAASRQPGGRSIPYPPQEAWCASMAAVDESGRTVVVVARHSDLYNSDWIVHTLVDPAAASAAIGCTLE